MNHSPIDPNASVAQLISNRIAELGDWRGATLARMRKLIKEADPAVVEEWKWNIPVWSHDGIICTGETYEAKVKLTFGKGAHLRDPKKLFNSSLEGNLRRAIDIPQGVEVNAAAFKALVKEAVALNSSSKSAKTKKASAKKAAPAKKAPAKKSPAKKAPAKKSKS